MLLNRTIHRQLSGPGTPPRSRGRSLRPPAAWRVTAFVLLVSSVLAPALRAQGFGGGQHKATLALAADRASYAEGAALRVAAKVTIEDHWHVNSNTPSYDYLIPTALTLSLGDVELPAEVEYPPHSMQKFAFTEEPIAVYDGIFRILAELVLPADTRGDVELTGHLRYQACDDRQCLPPITRQATLTVSVGEEGAASNTTWFAPLDQETDAGTDTEPTAGSPAGAPGAGTSPASTVPGFLMILVFAFLGGVVLNAMPCVLPVLSLKIFGLMKSAGQGRRHLLAGTLATTAGIVLSFWLLALAAVLASKTGAAVGWGIQFQQPGFVTFLAVVVVLFSLNMWGLFEIPLPQSMAQVAGGAQREGLVGHFVSGLFATLMATPCSAPFLGTAVGFALAQDALTIFTVFTAIGLGLASPYLIIAILPRAVDLMPKPGSWMVTVRGVMGFLLAAAAIWLFYVLAGQIQPESLALVQLSLLGVALATWLVHQAKGPSVKRFAIALGVVAAVASVAVAAGAEPASQGVAGSSRIAWQPFDEAEAEALSRDGRLVFVDFTADWCLTCKANERLVIETDAIVEAFETHEVVAMKGDWTNRDDTIGEYLGRYGRSSVPFYILYRPGSEPLPFGEVLTKGRVLDALAESVASLPEVDSGVDSTAGSR